VLSKDACLDADVAEQNDGCGWRRSRMRDQSSKARLPFERLSFCEEHCFGDRVDQLWVVIIISLLKDLLL
jgi:hypothetical protein